MYALPPNCRAPRFLLTAVLATGLLSQVSAARAGHMVESGFDLLETSDGTTFIP